MCGCSRRRVLAHGIGAVAGLLVLPGHGLTQALAPGDEALRQRFMAEAERMRRAAVAAGDQSYGAVVAVSNEIVGWGPSRVVTDRNPAAHAERVAIGDAQARLGTRDLAGAILYSTSRPCSTCEAVAASARISRMYWGPTGAGAGVPRG